MPKIELYALVTRAQEYISRNYATVLADKNRRQELENCIGKYLYDTAYTVEGYDTEALAKLLFTEMADYSVLTKYLSDPDIEEININGWDDVALTHLDGHIEKCSFAF